MRKVLVYGYASESNYGAISLILGFRELLRAVDPDAEMVCVENGPVPDYAREEHDFTSIRWPYLKRKRFWMDYVRFRFFGRKPVDPDCAAWWAWFDAADVVVNLQGIAFCSKLRKPGASTGWISAFKCVVREFSINLAAKLSGKLSVKSNASFGPMDTRTERLSAWLASRFAFDRMIAREHESALELQRGGGLRQPLLVAPDIANLMPVPVVRTEPDLVGLVTSFQMERQWKLRGCGYVETMVQLTDYVIGKGYRVLLIPNQDRYGRAKPVSRSDSLVAADIAARVADRSRVSVAKISMRSGLDRKSDIARCFLLISPRYHACVSAMTCAVPTLTLGWHVKYRELAQVYGQEEWIVPSEKCTLETLKAKFERMVSRREEMAASIRSRLQTVKQAVVEAGNAMLRNQEVQG